MRVSACAFDDPYSNHPNPSCRPDARGDRGGVACSRSAGRSSVPGAVLVDESIRMRQRSPVGVSKESSGCAVLVDESCLGGNRCNRNTHASLQHLSPSPSSSRRGSKFMPLIARCTCARARSAQAHNGRRGAWGRAHATRARPQPHAAPRAQRSRARARRVPYTPPPGPARQCAQTGRQNSTSNAEPK